MQVCVSKTDRKRSSL